MPTYPPGAPCWIDLGSPDPTEAASFYGGLFGWTATVSPEPETSGYTTLSIGDKGVAGLGPLTSRDQPPAWMVHFAVDDVDRVAAAVTDAGGGVVVGPVDVMAYGRMAVVHDPSGAVLGLWQPGSMAGADVMGEVGSTGWVELTTRDPEACKAFYAAALGWKSRDIGYDGARYTLWEVDGQPVGGMTPLVGDERPADVAPHWMVYFSVDDPDAVCARAGELGGAVSVPPTDTPAGRMAVLADPHGAVFSIIAPDPAFRP